MDYGNDILAGTVRRGGRRTRAAEPPEVPAEPGLVAEDPGSGFCGAVVGCDRFGVTLEDRFGKRRVFPLARAAFLIDGEPVTLVRPVPGSGTASGAGTGSSAGPGAGTAGARRSASGSIAVQGLRAQVARASRIYVEGVHDAELVEKVWGHDLRVEGVVVEYLEGIDDLPAIVEEFAPGPDRRLGVLVDHLVDGSKESRIATRVSSPHVLITGHPYIDIWAAVKPAAVGLSRWPAVPHGVPWKEGVLTALGWGDDVRAGWRRILGSVTTYTDLEPALLGRVEELIDFVTAPDTPDTPAAPTASGEP